MLIKRPKNYTLPSFTHPHVTFILIENTKDGILKNVHVALDTIDPQKKLKIFFLQLKEENHTDFWESKLKNFIFLGELPTAHNTRLKQ